jgi:hypothetical protein
MGAAVGVAAAVYIWLPTYYACTTGGCAYFHYVNWTTVGLWIIGGVIPVIAMRKVRFAGIYAFIAMVVILLTVLAFLFGDGFTSISIYSLASQPGITELLLVLLAGYGAEMAGLALLVYGTKLSDAPPPSPTAS